MDTNHEAYNELCYYTLPHGDPAFIHQHVVDAFAAQTCSENDKPIKLTFALAGLFLYVEKQFTGRQVQLRICRWREKSRYGRSLTCRPGAAKLLSGMCLRRRLDRRVMK
jgi:hypothetical protein